MDEYCDFDLKNVYNYIISNLPNLFDTQVLIEIGVWRGASIIYLAQLAQASGKKVQIFGVDTWEGSEEHQEYVESIGGPNALFNEFYNNVKAYNLLKYIIPLRMTSVQAAQLFYDEDVTFAFIDANHSYESVKQDIDIWYPKIRPGGVLAGHDYYDGNPESQGVVNAVKDSFGKNFYITHSCWVKSK